MSPDPTPPAADPESPGFTVAYVVLAVVVVVSIVVTRSSEGLAGVVAVGAITVMSCLAVLRLFVAEPARTALAVLSSAAAHSSNRVAELETHVATLGAERERERRRASRLGGNLATAQRELHREITMLSFIVDDVVEGVGGSSPPPAVIDSLKIALDHVVEGQRNVSALSRLGTGDPVDKIAAFTASDLTPLTRGATVSIERNEPIYGDVDLWRLFVENAVRNAEAHGRASVITLSSGQGRLIIRDDGLGCSTADLHQSWNAGLRPDGTRSDGTQIMRRIAEAHSALVSLHGSPSSGVRIEVDLGDFELDLRDRGVIAARIGTPHKASGGRVSPVAS